MKKVRKNTVESTIGVVFLIILFAVAALNFITPDKTISEKENRVLTSMPKLTRNNVTSGEFMKQFESYMSDQFVGRNMLREMKVRLDRLGGERLENDVYAGKDGELLETIYPLEPESLEANLNGIRHFSEAYSDISTHMMLVPDAACANRDRLPAFAVVEDQSKMINMVKNSLGDSVVWIDAMSAMSQHRTEKHYYKTDHHWTSLGAFRVFQEAAPLLGIEEDVSGRFVSYPVTDSFNGALAAKSGYSLSEKETIDIYVPTGIDNDVIVSYVDEGRRSASIYDSSKLEERSKYEVFLGGDTSVIDIRTMSTRTNRILILKDSFADCFVQFLTPYYREIIVVDPRYYNGTIDEIMDSYRITDVMFLYRGNTFFRDNNLSGVLTGE